VGVKIAAADVIRNSNHRAMTTLLHKNITNEKITEFKLSLILTSRANS
jgi:hypothetical protein